MGSEGVFHFLFIPLIRRRESMWISQLYCALFLPLYIYFLINRLTNGNLYTGGQAKIGIGSDFRNLIKAVEIRRRSYGQNFKKNKTVEGGVCFFLLQKGRLLQPFNPHSLQFM